MAEDGRQQMQAELLAAGPGVAVGVLAATRTAVESAKWHLRRIVDLGDQLAARRSGFEAVTAGNDEALVDACRKVIDGAAVEEALKTAERARAALAKLRKWEGRGDV